jgi:polysaccharide pyruvyl transferase WcaK-like protein
MKIGILTYHRAENYGALLQAYATKTYLQSLGHDVSFVDYWPKYHSDYFSIFPIRVFNKRNAKGKLSMLLRLALWGTPKYIRKRRLQKFMREKLGLPKSPLYTNDECKTEKYDVVVYGSDQIWRKQNLGGVGFDTWYFGSDNVLAEKKVAFAGSMGALRLDDEDESYVLQQMKNFDKLSVREKDLHTFLSLRGISSQVVSDPVFLLKKEEWMIVSNSCSINEKYILFYNLLNTRESVSFANRLSQTTGLPVVEINKVLTPSRFFCRRYVSCASVERFLSLIAHADYVVSNSFHGVAFSLIFEKQFFAVGMRDKANRVVSLLESLELKSRYVVDGRSLSEDDSSVIDYAAVKKKLQVLVDGSVKYLNLCIQQIN